MENLYSMADGYNYNYDCKLITLYCRVNFKVDLVLNSDTNIIIIKTKGLVETLRKNYVFQLDVSTRTKNNIAISIKTTFG